MIHTYIIQTEGEGTTVFKLNINYPAPVSVQEQHGSDEEQRGQVQRPSHHRP